MSMNINIPVTAIAISLVLSACGGGGGSSGGGGNISSQLVGVWDTSTTSGQVVDEYYTVIRSDGTGTDYDYLGDSFDQGPNCYLISDYTITNLGNNNYSIDYGSGNQFSANVVVESNTMTTTIEGIGTFTYPRSNLQESDFTPEC